MQISTPHIYVNILKSTFQIVLIYNSIYLSIDLSTSQNGVQLNFKKMLAVLNVYNLHVCTAIYFSY